jgi:trimeric autotransporter adhesin
MNRLITLLSLLIITQWTFGQLSGTKNIPGDYATLAQAISELNTQGVDAGGVTLNLLAGNPETAPVGGYLIGGAGSLVLTTTSSTSQVTIQGNGNTITAYSPQASGILHDAIFEIVGADWITITGFNMVENAANTTTTPTTSNNMTEWGVALLYVTTTNGAQNNTISNCTIDLNRTYQNTFGIYSNSTHSTTAPTTVATATTTAGGNSGLAIKGNTITDVNNGIIVVGPTAAADHNEGLTIGGSITDANSITDYGTTGTFSGYANVSGTVNGILVRNTRNFTVSYNTITSSNGGTVSRFLYFQVLPPARSPTRLITTPYLSEAD